MGRKSKNRRTAASPNAEKRGDEESNQSEDMGDDDEEVIVAAESNWMDADFLSFPGDREGDGGNGDGTKKSGNGKFAAAYTREAGVPNPPGRAPTQRRPPWMDDDAVDVENECERVGEGQDGRGGLSSSNHRSHHRDWQPDRHEQKTTPPLVTLHNEIVSFANLMKPTERERRLRQDMVDRVTDLAYRTFGGKDKCQVLLFGSQVTGLCLPASDIDFVIRLQGNDSKKNSKDGANGRANEEEEAISTGNPLHVFADAVREEFGTGNENDDGEEGLTYLEVIEQTRVPIIKFTVAPHDLDVDVCFDQPGGPEAAELMHRFMESMPPLRPLTVVLKHFLAARGINQPFTGGVGSYLLQLMIVSFLQHRSREDLRSVIGRGGGRYMNLGSLLLDFFELYGMDFNYVTTGISVRADGFYFSKGARGRKKTHWNPSRPHALAVENPLDLTADVGGGAYKIQNVARVFEHAFRTLLAHVSEPLERVNSILATIIPPTEEMAQRAERRREVQLTGVDDDDDKDTMVDLTGDGNSSGGVSTDNDSSGKKKRKSTGVDDDDDDDDDDENDTTVDLTEDGNDSGGVTADTESSSKKKRKRKLRKRSRRGRDSKDS